MKKSKNEIRQEMNKVLKKVEDLDNVTAPRLRESLLQSYYLEYIRLENKLKE